MIDRQATQMRNWNTARILYLCEKYVGDSSVTSKVNCMLTDYLFHVETQVGYNLIPREITFSLRFNIIRSHIYRINVTYRIKYDSLTVRAP